MVKAMAFMRTSRMDEAEDLTQSILVKAWRELPGLEQPAAFIRWLRMVAARDLTSWSRLAHRTEVALENLPENWLVAADLPEAAALARHRWLRLREALAGLSEANRTALMMHAWGDYSYEEIAEAGGVNVTTVEGRIFRARRQLDRELREERVDLFGDLIAVGDIGRKDTQK